MVTKEEVLGIIGRTSYLDWEFHLGDMGDGFYVQVQFDAPDSETGKVERQHCRKWYISKWMTETEVVDTLYKAVEAAVIHEMKENFQFKGRMIHNPHTSVAARYEACVNTEHRAAPPVVTQDKDGWPPKVNVTPKKQKSFLIEWDKITYVTEEGHKEDREVWKKKSAPTSIKEILDKAREQALALEKANKLARMKTAADMDKRYYGLDTPSSDDFLVNKAKEPICDDCMCERKGEKNVTTG